MQAAATGTYLRKDLWSLIMGSFKEFFALKCSVRPIQRRLSSSMHSQWIFTYRLSCCLGKGCTLCLPNLLYCCVSTLVKNIQHGVIFRMQLEPGDVDSSHNRVLQSRLCRSLPHYPTDRIEPRHEYMSQAATRHRPCWRSVSYIVRWHVLFASSGVPGMNLLSLINDAK